MIHSGDMTKGNILKTIILFSIPLMASNLMQQMYNTVDLLYAGNLLGTNASAAVGTSANIAYCVTSFFPVSQQEPVLLLHRLPVQAIKKTFMTQSIRPSHSVYYWV